jgi:hypothetical protein
MNIQRIQTDYSTVTVSATRLLPRFVRRQVKACDGVSLMLSKSTMGIGCNRIEAAAESFDRSLIAVIAPARIFRTSPLEILPLLSAWPAGSREASPQQALDSR